jgi:glycosyltransferase involved in cell wall biosynthesis
MPKVTVLMAVYNGLPHLREAVESIVRQTFSDFELVVVDDGSTDGSGEALAGLADNRIRLLVNEQNQGLTRSLNRGLQAARGEYVARLDADDICAPERLARQVAYLDSNPATALVGSVCRQINEAGEPFGEITQTPTSPTAIYYGLRFNNVLAHSSVMFRREPVAELGGYDEQFQQAQDYDLWSRLADRYPLAALPEPLIRLRVSPKSVSRQRATDQARFADVIRERNALRVAPALAEARLASLHRLGSDATGRLKWNDLAVLSRFNRLVADSAPEYVDRAVLHRLGCEKVRVVRRRYLGQLKRGLGRVFGLGAPVAAPVGSPSDDDRK